MAPKPQKTDTDQGLDAVMASARETFSGDPDNPIETPASTASATNPDPVVDPPDAPPIDAAATPADAGTDGNSTPTDPLPPDATADTAPTDDAGAGDDPPPEKKTFRFKDLESADKGYKEVQAKATKAEQDAAALRKKLSAYEQAEADKKAAEDRSTIITTYRDKLKTYATERQKAAMSAINTLDPDALGDDYETQVAEIMADKDADIEAWRMENQPDLRSPAAAPAAADGDDTASDQAYVAEKVTAAKLEIDDPVFVHFAGQAPGVDENGEPIEFDDQIQWAIDKTQGHYSKIEERVREEQRKAAKKKAEGHQAQSLPLGRGGSAAPSPTEPAAPIGIAGAMAAVASEQRYDGRGVR